MKSDFHYPNIDHYLPYEFSVFKIVNFSILVYISVGPMAQNKKICSMVFKGVNKDSDVTITMGL